MRRVGPVRALAEAGITVKLAGSRLALRTKIDLQYTLSSRCGTEIFPILAAGVGLAGFEFKRAPGRHCLKIVWLRRGEPTAVQGIFKAPGNRVRWNWARRAA